MEEAFNCKRSSDKVCGVCMETVWEKQPPNRQRFGILSDCTHVFCLECIRKWRSEGEYENEVVRWVTALITLFPHFQAFCLLMASGNFCLPFYFKQNFPPMLNKSFLVCWTNLFSYVEQIFPPVLNKSFLICWTNFFSYVKQIFPPMLNKSFLVCWTNLFSYVKQIFPPMLNRSFLLCWTNLFSYVKQIFPPMLNKSFLLCWTNLLLYVKQIFPPMLNKSFLVC